MRAWAMVVAAALVAGCLAGDPTATPGPVGPTGTSGTSDDDDDAPATPEPSDPPAPPAPTGSTAPRDLGPHWEFTDTEGVAHSRDSSLDRPVVLFFMASWCSTCRSKTPVLAEVHADYAPSGARFYSLSFDESDDAASLETWKARHAQPWPHGVDPGFAAQRAFGVTSQSSVVVLDGDGKVVRSWGYGGVREDALRAALDAASGPTRGVTGP